MDNIKELKQLIKTVELNTSLKQLYYFAYKWQLKNAIKCFEDSEIIVVDSRSNMWQRGKKIKRKIW